MGRCPTGAADQPQVRQADRQSAELICWTFAVLQFPLSRLPTEIAYAGERKRRTGSFVGSMPSAITRGSKLIFSHSAPFCGVAEEIVNVPTFTSLRSEGHNNVGLFSGSPGAPIVNIMSHCTGPCWVRSINFCSRNCGGEELSSSSDICFSPSLGTKRQRTSVLFLSRLTNLNV